MFSQFLVTQEDTALCLHSLSYWSCSAQSRQGQTLRAFPVLEGKTLRGISLATRGAHLKKNVMAIFLCWREKGTWSGSPRGARAWRRKHRVHVQGRRQRSDVHRARPHPSSWSLCWVCSCWGLMVFFGLEQQDQVACSSVAFSIVLELGPSPAERGQWLGDAGEKSKRSFQPLDSNELRAAKIYTMSLSNLNLLVSSVCSEHGKQFIPFLFIKL